MTRRRRPLEGRRVSLTGEEIAAIRWFIADGPNWFEDDEPFEPFLRRSIARSLHRKGLIDDATMKTIDGNLSARDGHGALPCRSGLRVSAGL